METPYCLAMLLCDQVYRDTLSGKVSVLGVFNQLVPPASAEEKSRFCVYVSLTDGHGECELNLKLRHAEADFYDDEDNIVSTPAQGVTFEFTDPLMVVEAVFIVECDIKKSGVYYCELHAAGERIMFRRMIVKRAGESHES